VTALRRLYALRWAERALLLETVLAVQLVKASVGLVPFRALLRLLAALAWILRRPRTDVPSLERVAWAVEAAGRRTVGRTTCLVEALAAQVVLAARGRPAELRFGVVRAGGDGLRAHAWVESGGRVVIGGSVRDSERYVQLVAPRTGAS
jgi:hypothetical protein